MAKRCPSKNVSSFSVWKAHTKGTLLAFRRRQKRHPSVSLPPKDYFGSAPVHLGLFTIFSKKGYVNLTIHRPEFAHVYAKMSIPVPTAGD
jgi:hypothetical protein